MTKSTPTLRLFFSTLTRWLLPVCLLASCVSPGFAQVRVEVRVDTRTTLHKIDPKIYAQFIEHVGRVVHSGLWAELWLNRKFCPVDPERSQVADPWEPESDLSYVSYVIDRMTSRGGVSPQRVTLFGESHDWRARHQPDRF